MSSCPQQLVTRFKLCLFVFMLCFLYGFSWNLFAGRLSWEKVAEEISSKYPEVQGVSIADLALLLEGEAAPLLLDTRTLPEFRVSHLPGAVHLSEVDAEKLPRDRFLVTYCSVGIRSAITAADLQERGFDNVRNLTGGIFQWANAGMKVESAGETALFVHPYNARWGTLLDPALHWQPE